MLYIAADHGGFALKEEIKKYLSRLGVSYEDLGAHSFIPTDDYPDVSFALAKKVASQKNAKGVLVCRSGQGACIAANKVRGIRATQSWNQESAKRSRNDDNSNIICLGGDFLTSKEMQSIIKTWLMTPFAKLPRYKRRLKKIADYEKNRVIPSVCEESRSSKDF